MIGVRMFLLPGRALLLLALVELFPFTKVSSPHPPTPPSSKGELTLPPKLQKELGKALEALRENKLPEARKHLDAVYRVAPSDTETNFLLGIYSSQMNDWQNAKSFFEKVLALSPNHLGALLSLGSALIAEQAPAEAARYFNRAVDVEPTSWRAHAALADACIRQGLLEESIHHAERALELGHSQAEIVLPLLARALQLHGDEQRAAVVFQAYLQGHSKDASAAQPLTSLADGSMAQGVGPLSKLSVAPSALPVVATATLLFPKWLPPDIDETVPSVEPGIKCNLDEILEKSGRRIREFVASVDRFTATEAITHESINKWGFASRPTRFEFDYLVSIKETRPGLLSVDEYRNSHHHSTEFPDGIVTTGLPALLLIFHPYFAQNFTMTCEGLTRSKGQPAWQVHFRQRPDRPSVIRTYQTGGPHGPVFRAALKGRAWIAADSFQMVRVETDIMDPLPQIRLVADHAAIEYGPVHFRSRNLEMWLPQTAEVFYDWRGRRSHRRHSFGNYLLYSVDDKQQITVPDAQAPAAPSSDVENPSPGA